MKHESSRDCPCNPYIISISSNDTLRMDGPMTIVAIEMTRDGTLIHVERDAEDLKDISLTLAAETLMPL